MSLYAVFMRNPKPELTRALKAAHPDHFLVHDTLLVIRASGSAKAIAEKAQISDAERRGLLIAQITADYFGYEQRPFWDWLSTTFRSDTSG